jgi:uncharacterized membrane protein
MEKENRFARFHAIQSLLLHVAWIVVFIAVFVIGLILTFALGMIDASLGALGGLLLTLIYLVVVVAYLGGLIFAAVKAYGGNWLKLPIIGNMAEKIVNK